jgi:cytochrome c biogenesis protein CcmG, thiol:disulfide interchange protein DsbE
LNLGVFGYPETYVIDKEGIIRYKHVGDLNQRNWDDKIKGIYEQLK